MINKKSAVFELLLVGTWILGNMSVNFMLPLLPSVAAEFHASPTLVKYSISIFLFGKAAGVLIYGPLSDRYGRRSFMLLGLFLYFIGNAFTFFTSSMTVLLLSRLIQGIGTSATVLMGRVMINDVYKNNKAAMVFSQMFLAASVLISCLPMMASWTASHFDWRFIFLIMAGYGLVMFVLCFLLLDETHHQRDTMNSSFSEIVLHYRAIVSHPLFLGYVLCSLFMVAGESAFNTASSFLLIKGFGVSIYYFGVLMTSLGLGHLVGTLLCGRLVKKYDLVNMMGIGVIILMLSACTMAILVNIGYASVLTIMLPMAIFYVGTGFIMTITAVGVVTPFPKLIATSSAASLLLYFGFSTISSTLMSHLPTTTARPVTLLIAVFGLLAFLAWYVLIVPSRKNEGLAVAVKA
ncbi:MAG: hypothetical protein A3F14_06300 [Gammaproteobacteria bacterium RIFCSPHIGHO2_12_FULL_43_28]|nr:MAG: hypothetical protein A3F14_06300 [Gammaproteobacteria bacterium RIFCSPHIGHO2_12_FULL_43_28]